MTRDQLYAAPLKNVGAFEFDDTVADVFPDMIRRSVPGYASMLTMIAQCAERYAQPKTSVYDLGCSLGAATRMMIGRIPDSARIIAVDSSEAMVSRLQTTAEDEGLQNLHILHRDIRDISINDASLVVLNLTLQFLPPEERTELISKVAAGTLPGGALILSEKICFADAAQQQLMTTLHHDFKRSHGYSELEIAQKRTAIEEQLIPETLETHVQRLQSAGYTTVCPWFQCFNFASILAVR